MTEESEVALGVDLGQSQDPTSIAVVERIRQRTDGKPKDRFILRLLEQAPLGEPYPTQAQRIKQIVARPRIAEHDPRIFMDFTGVGRPMYDIMRQQRVPRLVPVTITFQGSGVNEAGGRTVAKLDLISRLQALMHTGALQMPDTLPLAKTFRRELIDFRVSYTAVGNATFGAREGAHDDLVLAVALAVYGLTLPQVTMEPLRL